MLWNNGNLWPLQYRNRQKKNDNNSRTELNPTDLFPMVDSVQLMAYCQMRNQIRSNQTKSKIARGTLHSFGPIRCDAIFDRHCVHQFEYHSPFGSFSRGQAQRCTHTHGPHAHTRHTRAANVKDICSAPRLSRSLIHHSHVSLALFLPLILVHIHRQAHSLTQSIWLFLLGSPLARMQYNWSAGSV